jgi:hypothetical protein
MIRYREHGDPGFPHKVTLKTRGLSGDMMTWCDDYLDAGLYHVRYYWVMPFSSGNEYAGSTAVFSFDTEEACIMFSLRWA